MSWPEIKKSLFLSVIFSYSEQQQTISHSGSDVGGKVDFIWKWVMTISVVGTRRSSKALPKARFAPEKVTVTIWWSASLIHYSFLNPRETITSEKYAQQIGEMQWKLQHLQSPFLVDRKDPILHDSGKLPIAQPMSASKDEQIWLWMFASSAIFTWLLTTTSSSISTTFYREDASTTSRRQKMLSKSSWNPVTRIFMLRNKQTYFLLAKMCWL